MNWLNNVRMAPKLIGSFILMTFLAAVVGGIGLRGLQTMRTNVSVIMGNALPGVLALGALDGDVHEAMRNSRGVILSHDPVQKQSFAQRVADAEGDAVDQFRTYAALPTGSAHERAIASQVWTALQQWRRLDARVTQLSAMTTTTAQAQATRLSLGPEQATAHVLGHDLELLTSIRMNNALAAGAQAQQAQQAAVTRLSIVLALAVLAALALGLLLARSIAGPLHRIAEAAARIARGDTSARIDLQRRDELGALAASLRAMVSDLQDRATTDHITALGNHRAYQEEMRHALAHARRHGEPLSLALIDLDDFKLINDQHGHAQGDRVLAALGTLLKGVRASDRAFRLGGDEFAWLLHGSPMRDTLIAVQRLRQEADRLLHGATVSIGLAAYTPGAADVDADMLREQADAALYEAKRRGRNTVVAFEEIEDAAAIASRTKVQAVRRLLVERCVKVAFQPIRDVERYAILAFEALARPDEQYGLDGPAEAFAIAEKLGHAPHLDALCRQAALARAAELPGEALLFLNLSPQTLEHNALAGDTLVREVTAAGLTPARVVLEITERAVTRPAVVVREARRLRALGFGLALDDAGAGNAGLEMLSQLPVDYVKIDRAVVARASTDTTAQAVLAALIAFARQAGTFVIAEGIETEEMLSLVRRAGVQGAQGYLLGRPSTLHILATPAVVPPLTA